MPSSTTSILRPISTLAVAVLCAFAAQNVQAAETAAGEAITAGNMMEQCKQMHAQKQQMMSDMKVEGAALTEQVAQMNKASADAKLGLLAALVTRMAEQRVAREAQMATMGDAMMKHMTQHMQMDKESMLGCPMMMGAGMKKTMIGMDNKAVGPGTVGNEPK